jgi:hypothetical protein
MMFHETDVKEVLYDLLRNLKHDGSTMYTLLKEDNGIDKLIQKTIMNLYKLKYPSKDDWEIDLLYLMRNDKETKRFVIEFKNANKEMRKRFIELCYKKGLLQKR